MELQLGLALWSVNNQKPPSVAKGFGLTTNGSNGFEPNEVMGSCGEWCYEDRCTDDKTMALFVWSGQPNEEDDRKGERISFDSAVYKNDEDDEIVGWPPIKSWRKNFLNQNHNHNQESIMQRHTRNGSPIYVKVKMEGVGILRKIDLTLFHSYHTLTTSLLNMFVDYHRCDIDAGHCIFTYQNKQGDWLQLAGDLPWQNFVESVLRMEILIKK